MSKPNEELLRALNKLEEFTQDNLKEETRFEEVKDLLQSIFFSQYRAEKEKQKRRTKKELIKSIGLVKSYLPLIDRYRHGSVEEQKFAALVTRTIERYNTSILSIPRDKQVDAIAIKTSPRIAYRKVHSEKGQKIDALFQIQKPPSKPPSQEEIDTLKMKAIRLIESESGFKEALIETFRDHEQGNLHEIGNDGKTVTLMQTWSELPGEVHRIVGAFKREARHSIPIKDSFKIYLESIQPGHPYPPQRMGWSLSHWLIPGSVIWIDQIPLLQPLLERKARIAEALLPNGNKNLRARKIYRLKKAVFEENHLEYLTFHQELAHAIVRASPYGDENLFHQVINRFFVALSHVPDPFESLCQASAEMNRIFIEAPFETIEELRLRGELSDMFSSYETQRKLQEKLWLDTESTTSSYELAKKEYLLHMGRLLGDAATLLLQLQLSEKMKVKPPPLSDFELKIQACAFKHLIEFLEELEQNTDLDHPLEKAAIKQRMRSEISSEIALFSVPSFEQIDPFLQELTEETVSYFHARFHAND